MKRTYRGFRTAVSGRGASLWVEPRTLTVPDVVPSLKDIILSGSAQRVGPLLYDDNEEEGVRRLFAQGAPLEMILSAQLDGFPSAGDAKDDAKEDDKEPKEKPAALGATGDQEPVA